MASKVIELRGHRVEGGLRALGEVVGSAWVGGQVVKFGLGGADIQILARAPGFERAPAESALGQIGAGIRGLIAVTAAAPGLRDAQQRLSRHLRGHRDRGDFQQGRSNVHEPYLGGYSGGCRFRGWLALWKL